MGFCPNCGGDLRLRRSVYTETGWLPDKDHPTVACYSTKIDVLEMAVCLGCGFLEPVRFYTLQGSSSEAFMLPVTLN